jgi:hypothetical protein
MTEQSDCWQLNHETGFYEPAIPSPFYWGLIPWIWLRLTGYRDKHGRKAQLLLFWGEF